MVQSFKSESTFFFYLRTSTVSIPIISVIMSKKRQIRPVNERTDQKNETG